MPHSGIHPRFSLALDGLAAIQAIRDGVHVEIIDDLVGQGIVSSAQIYRLICSKRTLARRRSRGERLTSGESERLLRVLRIVDHAVDSFGDAAKAGAYLSRPMTRFEGQSCMEMLDTDVGFALVEELLARIDHGVPG
ncbi:DUF2384 domain-containing protein [Ectothiorhodospiraceae bacterium WFHF3C12]|nr:DUF2384 domain-containing protein [Ectothiorhodospiraceae bacterium WFHF3C12]